MNILVIGNGFDLAHKLPTKYSDFLIFVKEYLCYYNDNDTDKISIDKKKAFDSFRNNELELYNELFSLINDNRFTLYFLSIYEELVEEGKENWIDFETEISNIIQALDGARISFDKQYKSGVTSFKMEKWQQDILIPVFYGKEELKFARAYTYTHEAIFLLRDRLVHDLHRLTRSLEIYLSCFIPSVPAVILPIIKSLDVDKVLSFNYTSTFSIVYDHKIECSYIHGRISKINNIENNNMVLGIEEYLNGDAKDNDNEFIYFKKFYQRIIKMTGSKYRSWLAQISKENDFTYTSAPKRSNVYFYGHSMDPTDSDILKEILLNPNIDAYIYYLDKPSLSKQILNLVKIIGEENLIELTDAVTGRIKFLNCK